MKLIQQFIDHHVRAVRDSRRREKWRIDIRDAAGARHRDTFLERETAQAAVALYISARENSKAGLAPPAPDIPLEDLREKYLANLRAEKRSPRYIANMNEAINEGLKALGAATVNDIAPAKVETWKLALLKPMPRKAKKKKKNDDAETSEAPETWQRTNRTVNIKIKALQQMLNYGVRKKFIAANPIAGFELLPDKSELSRLPDNLTVDEVRRLLDAAAVPYRKSHARAAMDFLAIVIVALETGMRRGEVLNLEFADVDGENNVIRLRAKTVAGVKWRPKWGKARNVPMSALVRKVLQVRQVRLKSGLIFPGPSGKLREGNAVYHRLKCALRRAEIAGWRQYGFHTLRHTFISHQMQAGMLSPQQIQKITGQTFDVLKLYSHIRADEVKNLRISTPYGRK